MARPAARLNKQRHVGQQDAAPVEPQQDAAPVEPQQNAAPIEPQQNAAPIEPQQNAAPIEPQQDAAPVKLDLTEKETFASTDEPKKDFYLPFFINFMCSPGMKTAIAFLLAASVVAFVAATCGVGGAVVASGLLMAGYATSGAGTGLLAGHLLCATGLFSKSNKVPGDLPPTHTLSPASYL